MNRLLQIVIVACALLFQCSNAPTDTAGGTTDTGNARVASTALDSLGNPLAGAEVRIRPVDHLTDTSGALLGKTMADTVTVVTDSDGYFEIDSVDTGEYNLEINFNGSLAKLIYLSVDEDTILEPQTLEPTATLSGNVNAGSEISYVQIYGIDRVFRLDALGSFSFDDIPSGEYTLRFLSASGTYIMDTVITFLNPNDTRHIDTLQLKHISNENYSAWSHSTTLTLKTRSVAQITEDVTAFPMLVFLNYYQVQIFLQAQSSGSDVRFSASDGTPLPYEIEYWRTDSIKSSIWVRMDHIYADRDDQYIMMYWGNPLAEDRSDGSNVFRTTDGFAGVWHLNEESPNIGTPDAFKDATGNGNDGDDYINSDRKNFEINRFEQYFDAAQGDYIDCGNDPSLDIGNKLTISGYYSGDASIFTSFTYFSKRTIGQQTGFELIGTAELSPTDTTINFIFIGSETKIIDMIPFMGAGLDDRFFSLVINDTTATLFSEGTKVTSWSITPLQNDNAPFYIGRNADGSNFYNGALDEIRFSSVARSDSWVILDQINQRKPQEFLEIGVLE